MKICPQCNTVYPEDYIFCLTDGNSLIDTDDEQETLVNRKVGIHLSTDPMPSETDVICSSCGLANRAHSRFCKKCGTAFSNDSPANQIPFGNPQPGFSGFDVPINPNPQPAGNPPPEETVVFQTPAFTPPTTGPTPAPPPTNRNMIYALLAVGGIAILIVGLAIYQSNSGTKTSGKDSTRADSGNRSDRSETGSNSSGGSNEADLPTSFERNYSGTIAGKPFSMSLKRDGSVLNGTASTHRVDKVYGTIEDDGTFELKGYENDDAWTGNYRGQIYSDGSISGNWTTRQDTKPTSFYLNQLK